MFENIVMGAILFRLLLIIGQVIPAQFPKVVTRPVSADWCQCVIFVLNLMGIEPIPGEYWTAASLTAGTALYGHAPAPE
ncbi:MAG: hypothetical protein WCG34_10330 [Leptolinea sp.]